MGRGGKGCVFRDALVGGWGGAGVRVRGRRAKKGRVQCASPYTRTALLMPAIKLTPAPFTPSPFTHDPPIPPAPLPPHALPPHTCDDGT